MFFLGYLLATIMAYGGYKYIANGGVMFFTWLGNLDRQSIEQQAPSFIDRLTFWN
jgi:hypothetical protein